MCPRPAKPYAALVSDPQPGSRPGSLHSEHSADGEHPSESARPPLKPLDPPTVPFAIGGMIVWLIAWLVVYLAFRDDHPSWPAICIAGFLLGFPGLAIMIVHDRHRRHRRNAATPPDVS
jgi:hypothetical protein